MTESDSIIVDIGLDEIIVSIGSPDLAIDLYESELSIMTESTGIPGPQGPPGPSIQWTSVRRSDELTPYAYALATSIAGWRIRRWTAATKVISVATGADADDAETAWTARATQVYS